MGSITVRNRLDPDNILPILRAMGLGSIQFAGVVPVSVISTAFDFYTAIYGSDSNNGLSLIDQGGGVGPFRTIGKGIQALTAGKSLGVRGGTYDELLDNQHFLASGTSWSNKIRIANYGGETVTLRALSGFNPGAINLGSANRSYIEFDGININCLAVGCNRQGFTVGRPSHHVRLKNFTVLNNNFSEYSSNGCDADDCEFLNWIASGGGNGTCGLACSSYSIYLSGSRCIIGGFDFSDCSGGSVHVYRSSAPFPEDNVIMNGRVHHLVRSGVGSFFGVVLNGNNNLCFNVLADHCDVLSASGDVAFHAYSGTGNKFYHCTAGDNDAWGFIAGGTGGGTTGTEFRNCLSRGNSKGDVSIAGNAVGTIQTDNSWQDIPGQDPLFVAPASGNYHLQSGSPARDKGNRPASVTVNGITYTFDTDRDGIARPSVCDLGLYEFV